MGPFPVHRSCPCGKTPEHLFSAHLCSCLGTCCASKSC